MKMSGDLRVKTSRRRKALFKDICDAVFPQNSHELFFLCACLGYREEVSIPLSRDGEEQFWSKTITYDEYTCYYSMILKDSGFDMSSLSDDAVVIKRIEEYANGGLDFLAREVIPDLIVESEGEERILPASKKMLPKTLLFSAVNHIPPCP
jgi:hypothetical protein